MSMETKNLIKEIRAAIKANDSGRVRAIIAEDPHRLQMTTSFGTLLHEAATWGKLEIVKLLVDMGIDVNRVGNSISGGSAIHTAADKGALEIVRYLLDHGANLDVSDSAKNPLFAAIYSGHFEVAKLLIERGIDTQIRYTGQSMKNMDALAFAEEWGRAEIKKLIEENRGKGP